ncbi:uncharacterized protein LOC123322976 [Coccinella septempunctata]|uniref:uncharacterized protein LOC123322976 n=1 Tax=Coccinella septempunctata TaxID=41139 RepID=UPI001D08A90D|nr:uncharacterized protein LOC123322976 [Coccinella septempunctata]
MDRTPKQFSSTTQVEDAKERIVTVTDLKKIAKEDFKIWLFEMRMRKREAFNYNMPILETSEKDTSENGTLKKDASKKDTSKRDTSKKDEEDSQLVVIDLTEEPEEDDEDKAINVETEIVEVDEMKDKEIGIPGSQITERIKKIDEFGYIADDAEPVETADGPKGKSGAFQAVLEKKEIGDDADKIDPNQFGTGSHRLVRILNYCISSISRPVQKTGLNVLNN